MSDRIHADLLAVIDAVKIESPLRYSSAWNGPRVTGAHAQR